MQVFKTKIIFLLLIFGTLFVHSVLLTKTFFYCVDTFSTISPYLSEQTQLVLVSSAVFQWLTTWPAERFHSTSWCTQSFPVLMCSSRTSGNKQKSALWWLWYINIFESLVVTLLTKRVDYVVVSRLSLDQFRWPLKHSRENMSSMIDLKPCFCKTLLDLKINWLVQQT